MVPNIGTGLGTGSGISCTSIIVEPAEDDVWKYPDGESGRSGRSQSGAAARRVGEEYFDDVASAAPVVGVAK